MSGNSIEYSVVCIDNSDYMRNEDVRPNRFLAEKDSANIILHHILTSRPENRVSMVTLSSPEVIQSLTNNEIKVMSKLYAIEMKGEIDLTLAIKIALLPLKQIASKGLVRARHRIIVFIGSPLKENEEQLNGLVQKLNKHKISVDFINYGSENESRAQVLQSFVSKLRDSHLVNVPNNRVMANVLAESPILSNSRQVSLINENIDPELALAMKLSVEKSKDQFEEDLKRALDESTQNLSGINVSKTDDQIQKAIAMSLDFMMKNDIPIKESHSEKTPSKSNNDYEGLTDEEQLALSLQMSLLDSQKKSTKDSSNSSKKNTRKRRQSKKTIYQNPKKRRN